MLNYSFPCSCSKNLSSFRFIIKQQWTIEENSIFSNSSHLEWRAGLSDTILKGTHPRTIFDRFGLIWFKGFRGEDLNVKVYDGRMTTDAKWWQKLTWPLARWAKKSVTFLVLVPFGTLLPLFKIFCFKRSLSYKPEKLTNKRLAFLLVSNASTNKFYAFWQYTVKPV
jgi:hypothetical protein